MLFNHFTNGTVHSWPLSGYNNGNCSHYSDNFVQLEIHFLMQVTGQRQVACKSGEKSALV